MFSIKTYANKEAKREDPDVPKANRVSVLMSLSEAQAIANGEKEMLRDLVKAMGEVVSK